MKKYITIDIGGTDIKYGIINENRELLFHSMTPTQAMLGANQIIRQIINIYQTLSKEHVVEGLAISTTGVIDDEGNSLIASPLMPGWDTINIQDELRELNTRVSIENDVNCMALCEQSLLEGAEAMPCLLAMTIGTGIGGSIFINGQMHKGFSFSAGEIGKMILNEKGDSFESLAATSVLVKMAQSVDSSLDDGVKVFKCYDQGNKQIIEVVETYYRQLAIGIANLIYILNPNHIIIGGGVTNRGKMFLNELMQHLNQVLQPYFMGKVKLSIAKHKNSAGMIGAFIHFENTYLK